MWLDFMFDFMRCGREFVLSFMDVDDEHRDAHELFEEERSMNML